MRVVLARHGEVEKQYHRCYNGHIDIALSLEGQAQAKRLYTRLNDQRFDAVYASDLLRAVETVKPFSADYVVNYTPCLREKSWGRHEGLTYGEIVAMEGREYENFLQWLDVLDGEAYDHYVQRVRLFFQELFAKSYESVLVVTHAGVIRVLSHLIEGIPLEEAFTRSIGYGETIEIVSQEFFDA